MISPILQPITIDGIEYEVEFNESTDMLVLMSSVKDVEIVANDLISSAIVKYGYVNDFGDDDCSDSDIVREIEENADEFIRKNFANGSVSVWNL